MIKAWMNKWEPPIGVFVGPDTVGRQVAQMCIARGWRVPQDVAIITAYNDESICEQPSPSLTSVEVGFDRIGYESARLLDGMMNGERPPKQPILLPPVGIVARESTDFFAVDDELVAAALRFIAANSHQPITSEDVAGAVNVLLRTLQRRFNEHLGRPIATEIRRVRLERAKRELAHTDRPVYLIAKESGFGITKRLNDIFRRELGMTPSEFRQQHRSAEGRR